MILKEFLKKIETTSIYQFEVKYVVLLFDKAYSKQNENGDTETFVSYDCKSLSINTDMNIYNTLIFMNKSYYLYRYVIDASFDLLNDKKELIIGLVHEDADIDKTYTSQYLEDQQLKIEKLIDWFHKGFTIENLDSNENNEPITVKRLKEILQNEPDDSVVTFLGGFSTLRDKLNTVAINSVTNVEGKIVLVANDYYYDIDQRYPFN